jgi:hypothetical protein
MAEDICRHLETLELDHNDIVAGMVGAEIRGLLAPDVEAPEPPPEPEESEIEAEEPDPDAIDDDERKQWQEHNAEVAPEDQIPEFRWREYYADRIE